MRSFTISLILLFSIAISNTYCQNIYKNNLRKITNLYLKYIPTKFAIDTGNTVFIISAFSPSSTEDELFFNITASFTNSMVNFKYSSVYDLGGYKLIINESANKHSVLDDLFKKRSYENLNRGQPDPPGMNRDDFHQWYFLMNNRFEIIQVNGLPPNFRPVRNLVKMLKKHNVIFANKSLS